MEQLRNFPIKLTLAQRKALAGVIPILTERLALGDSRTFTVMFTLGEIRKIAKKCSEAILEYETMRRYTLNVIAEEAASLLEWYKIDKLGYIPAQERVYQFKIVLIGVNPPIWRRIQTKDCSLDKLHEHIQTAMGWTNSHLHEFMINGIRHGDPELIGGDWMDEQPFVDSLMEKISSIVISHGKSFSFYYEYDFGDSWDHEIKFEGCFRAEEGTKYPICVDGKRNCPPDDVGGIYGYKEYLRAITNPRHKEHESYLEWNGPFDPEKFDVQAITRRMRKGLPNWRKSDY